MNPVKLLEHTDTVNELLARYGVKFGRPFCNEGGGSYAKASLYLRDAD